MKKLLALTAGGEAALGLVLMVYPPVVARLLFDAEIAGPGMVMGRVAGIALIALGVSCWSGRDAPPALWGMLTYSVLVTLYLTYLGMDGKLVGRLLWPAVVLHVVLASLLVRAWRQEHGKTS